MMMIHRLYWIPSYKMPNEEAFDLLTKLFITKWRNVEANFVAYFKSQWLQNDVKYWFEGAFAFAPSTNNALESTNNRIKDKRRFWPPKTMFDG